MQQDQESLIIQDEPLKVLGLFPRRIIDTIVFDEEKFNKLYNTLCCTICQELFNNPVYLKCSHRFCKECLEKYIRINQKKSCPNCRGDLNTKRDLKLDYGTNSLINYAYGNRNKFCQTLGHLENIESQNINKISVNKNLSPLQGLIRTKSFADQEPKSPKKKIKTLENQQQQIVGQTRGRKKKNKLTESLSSKPLQIQDSSRTQQIPSNQPYDIVKENQTILRTDDILSPPKRQQVSFQKQQYAFRQYEAPSNMERIEPVQAKIQVVKKKRGRKKKQVPVFIAQTKSIDLEISSVAGISANQQIQQGEIDNLSNIGTQQQDEMEKTLIKKPSFTTKNISQQSSQKITSTKPYLSMQPTMESFEKQRKILSQQFGQDYMLNLMRIPILDFLIEIKLQRHPQCYFTPFLTCKSIQPSTKCKVHQIFVLLGKILNVQMKNIKVYIGSSDKLQQLTYEQNKKRTILQLNEIYWKSAADVQVFDMKEILSALDENNLRSQNLKSINQSGQVIKKKKLFQGINIERQQKLIPKKRGRGRIKKVQEKQNSIEVEKEEFKRILYYRLVLE